MSEKAYAIALRVVHPNYPPEVIASGLGMMPEIANCVGSARATPTGRLLEGDYKETYCVFKLQSRRDGYFVDGVRLLLPLLEMHSELLIDVKKTGGGSELHVGVFTDGSSGFTLSADDMAALCSLNISLSVEYYF